MTEINLPPIASMPSALAADPRMTKRRWKLSVALSARYNFETGRCDPSHQTLADDTCMYPLDVRKELDGMKADGLIDWEKRTDANGGRISNNYILHFMAPMIDARERSREKPESALREKPATNIEGNIEDNSCSADGGSTPRKKTRIPSRELPTESMSRHGKKMGLSETQLHREGCKFLNHHLAKDTLSADWEAEWRKWVANAIDIFGLKPANRARNLNEIAG